MVVALRGRGVGKGNEGVKKKREICEFKKRERKKRETCEFKKIEREF